MDATLLTQSEFWEDPTPVAAGDFPGGIPEIPELRGQVLFETSGSSGTPKWIVLSKKALLVSAAAVNRHLRVDGGSRWGLALPLRHVGGFGVAARACAAACDICEFGRRWDARDFASWIGGNAISHSSLVPTQVYDLVRAGLGAPASLRAIVVGGGRLDPETGRAARALGWPVLASYGMTEAGSQVATQAMESLHLPYHPDPIPLLPIWHADCADDGRLRITGDALFSGILVPQGGRWIYQARTTAWHLTEDRVLLENRNLTPLGRSDLRVKVLGELVDLESLERDLGAMSGGGLPSGSFVIVAVPHARSEHVLVPVFDVAVGSEAVQQAMVAFAGGAPGFHRLQAAVTLEDFPRSPLGKPLRSECLARVMRDL